MTNNMATYFYTYGDNQVEVTISLVKNGFIIKIGIEVFVAKTLKEALKLVSKEFKPTKEKQ
jgi:prefoldin subunit 5